MKNKAKEKTARWGTCTPQEKEAFTFYRDLGYQAKTAEVLARFTYGDIHFRQIDIDRIYDMLQKGMSPREIAGWVNSECPPCDYERISNPVCVRRLPMSVVRRMRNKGMTIEQIRIAGEIYDKTGYIPKEFERDYEEERPAPKSMPRERRRSAKEALPCSVMPDCLEESSDYLEDSVASPMQREGQALFAELLAGNMVSENRQFRTGDSEVIEEKGHRDAMLHPTSTFRMTTNTASTGMIRTNLRGGWRIDKNAVRVEEMLNDFRYELEKPKQEMFSLSWGIMPSANGSDSQLLMLGVQGKKAVRKRQNIVLLLDISGSMSDDNICTQAAVATIVSQLKDGDIFSFVTYSVSDTIIFDGLEVRSRKEQQRILSSLMTLSIGSATNGSVGIEKAYEIGRKHFIEDGNNQVILITDGDLNFGITRKGELQKLIEEKRQTNLFLSVIGVGLSNYRDDKLEVIAKNGNGVYRAANSIADVRRSVYEDYDSLVNVIAKDVKGQIEFNPEVVDSYRLLGFENREIAHEDFRNDKVISEPFGNGGYGVVLYELHMRKGGRRVHSELKYQTMVTNASGELATFKVRYKEPLAEESREQEIVIPKGKIQFNDNMRLAYVIYVCAELLRDSKMIDRAELEKARKFRKQLGKEIVKRNGDRLALLDDVLGMYE